MNDPKDTQKFLDAAANWADSRAADINFIRDEYDGWCAVVRMSDSRGPFSATVNAVVPRKKTKETPAETTDEFEARVGKMLLDATATARRKRIVQINRLEAA